MEANVHFEVSKELEVKAAELSRAAEQNLLGAVLRGGSEVYKQVKDIVSPESFRVETFETIWRAVEQVDSEGRKIDVYTVQDELERMGCMDSLREGVWHGSVLLANIRGAGIPDNALSYADNVADYAAKRFLYKTFSTGAAHSLNGRRAKEIIADAMTEMSKVVVHGVEDEYTVPLSVALSEAFDWSTRAAAGEMPGVQTGFLDLDSMLSALMPGNVYIIAGRPGTGKTALLVTIIKFLAEKGYKVAIFSLEMSRMQVAQRLIAQEAGLNLKNIIDGKLSPDEWAAYGDAIAKLEQSGISINDLSSINIGQIRGTSRKLKAKLGGLDLVIVDYIQLAQADNKKKSERRELEVSEVSRGLKYLARELEVPILAAAQLSREVERRGDKRPILSDLRESGSLEQDAYCVMFIHRNLDEPEPKQNITEIIVAKHRNGAVGSVELVFRPELAKFENGIKEGFRNEPNKPF